MVDAAVEVQPVVLKDEPRLTKDGLRVSSSEITRLQKQLKFFKEQYDGLRIKMLTRAGVDTDPAKKKADESTLEQHKKQIKKLDQAIVEIKIELHSK